MKKIIFLLFLIFCSSVTLGQFQPDTPLSQANASFIGEAANDEGGWIQPAGDVNGDGFADILVSSWLNDENGVGAGQAYLLLGSSDLGWGMDFDLSQADASFQGEAADDWAGMGCRSAGDVNNDGYDDFLIGALNNDESATGAGQAYLFLGGDTIDWTIDESLSVADASFLGEAAGDRVGNVGPAGDVNGDGYDDFLIGAHLNSEAGSEAGQVYLILGRGAADWGSDFDLTQADASFLAESTGDQLSSDQGLGTAGDVNGDGYDDFLIGADHNDEGGSNAGQVYLILGREAADWGMDYNLSQADASFLGEASNNYLHSVTDAGDLNGDGYDDFMMGAGWNDEGGSDAGQVYLILGSEAADWGMDYDLSQADASFIGENQGRLECSCGNGDINGDGFVDILLGGGHYWRGESYLMLGNGLADWGMDYHLGASDYSFRGEGSNDWAGYVVAMAGDVNGDNLDDLLISALLNDEGGTNAGQGYLIFGDIIDVQDCSMNASLVGLYDVSGDSASANEILVHDNHAYIAYGSAGIRILDITDPSNAIEVSHFNVFEEITSLAINQGLLFAGADGQYLDALDKVYLIDITDPALPIEITTIDSLGGSVDLKAKMVSSGNFLYVHTPGTLGYGDLHVIDISVPTNPVETGSVAIGRCLGISCQNSYVYKTYLDVRVYDCIDPYSPELVEIDSSGCNPWDVGVQEEIAYIADRVSGLFMLNSSDPTNLTVMNQIEEPCHRVAVSENYIYTIYSNDNSTTLHVYDNQYPGNVSEVGYYRIGYEALDIAASEGHVYIASRDDGILIIQNDLLTSVEGQGDQNPQCYFLLQNYPNPFNPTTAISYQLSADSEVELTIYDIAGRKITTLVNEYQSSGYHTINWDASEFSSGIYFYRLKAGEFVETKKMVLMK